MNRRVSVRLMAAVCAVAPAIVCGHVSADTMPQVLPFSQSWTDIGLIATVDDWSGVPGIIGYRGDEMTGGTAVDPQTVVAEGALVVDVNTNQTNPDTFMTGGVAEFHITDPVVALAGSGTARAPHIVISLDATGMTSIVIAYNLRDIDGSTDNAIQPVALQYRIGSSGDYTNLPAGFVADASTGPSLATLETPVSVTLPAAADDQALVQVRIITTDAVGNDEWIGIDDIAISGTCSTLWYADVDGDGFGDPAVSQTACTQPEDYVADNTDCDDTNDTVYPGAPEICDGLDNDCDTSIDEGVGTTWYADADGDDFGDPAVSQTACTQPKDYVADNTDCDDSNAAVHPGATEVCNGIDDNCVGGVDEGVTLTFYADADGDGFGDAASSVQACEAPPGHVADNTDCDDDNDAVHPGAPEICDDLDNDCDTLIDDDDPDLADAPTWYPDNDGDTFGSDTGAVTACEPPAGPPVYVSVGGDCDDDDPDIHPGAIDECNTVDDDCDGTIDEDCPDTDSDGVPDTLDNCPATANPDQADADNDGIGDACEVVTNDMCAGATPLGDVAAEVFDNSTATTDGPSDPGCLFENDMWFVYQPTVSAVSRFDALGLAIDFVVGIQVFQGSACPPTIPLGCALAPPLTGSMASVTMSVTAGGSYLVRVGGVAGTRGFGIVQVVSTPTGACCVGGACVQSTAANCASLSGDFSGTGTDCASYTFYRDQDEDSYGDATNPTVSCLSTTAPTGYVANDDDCDDGDPAVNPLAVESCDGVDNNCDGSIDEGFTPDGDGDGVPDCSDNCDNTPNPSQADCDNDGIGDACAGAPDCNANNVPDSCDIAAETSDDSDSDGIPDECECPANIFTGGASATQVDVDDLIAVILAWGVCEEPCPPCEEDTDFNCAVDVDDLIAVILAWGPCDP